MNYYSCIYTCLMSFSKINTCNCVYYLFLNSIKDMGSCVSTQGIKDKKAAGTAQQPTDQKPAMAGTSNLEMASNLE